jgi:hypothetical protein
LALGINVPLSLLATADEIIEYHPWSRFSS